MATRMTLPERVSPLHAALEHLHPTWGRLHAMPVALGFAPPQAEAETARRLGLADASALPRITLKGSGAAGLLKKLKIGVPDEIFGVRPLGALGLAARTGGAEFFLEDGPDDGAAAAVQKALTAGVPSVYPVWRADACILLSGSRATEVLEQTCAYNFRQPDPRKLVYTRVAGVSCSLLPRTLNDIPLFQLWMDGTFGEYLWETLVEIAGENSGAPVGLSCFFPTLLQPV